MSDSAYHAPDKRAGYTDKDIEEYGDAVLMTWRDWVNLRDRLDEERISILKHVPPSDSFYKAYRNGIEWAMREMDEMLP